MKYSKRLVAGIFLILASGKAMATETGASVYPLGIEGFTASALPPPGAYFLGYYGHYSASRFANGSGHAGLIPNFKLSANVAVTRFVYVTDKKFLGADYAFQAVVPIVKLDLSSAGTSNSKNGLVDPVVDPVILGWHVGNLHISTCVDISIPVGTYDRYSLANVSSHYWNFEPVLAIAYYGPSGLTIDTKLMYDIPLSNHKAQINAFNPTGANYRSGQAFHMDYAVGWTIRRTLEIGVAGYFYHQTSKDRISQQLAEQVISSFGGFQGRAAAVGPSVQYRNKSFRLIATYTKDVSAAYRPQGDKVWLKLIIPLSVIASQ